MRPCTFVQLPNSPLQCVVSEKKSSPLRLSVTALAVVIGVLFSVRLLMGGKLDISTLALEKPTAMPSAFQQLSIASTELKANNGGSSTSVGPTFSLSAPSIPTPPATNAVSGPQLTSYVVRNGDALIRIARRHGTTVKALRAVNDLKGDRIVIGQKLWIPPATATQPRGPT
jgi:LysM repeat protein